MYRKQALERKVFSPASLNGQGIVAAPKAATASEWTKWTSAEAGARKTRNCGKPGFLRSKKWPKNSNDIWLERGRIKDTSEIKHFYELDKEYILALIVRTNNEPVINKYLQYILSLIDFTLPDIYIEYYLLYAENYV